MDSKAKLEYDKGNYDEALGIYEQLIRETPDHGELYLGRAQTLAMLARLSESLEGYKCAKLLAAEVREGNFDAMVDGLIKKLQETRSRESKSDKSILFIVSCNVCTGILNDPVTFPCGHSACDTCWKKLLTSKKCKSCEEDLGSYKLKTNVILQEILKKNFARQLESTRLRIEGNVYLNQGKESEAFDKYTEAEILNPDDHLLQSNLSHVLLSMGKFNEALEKGARTCELRPDWAKGYYRKGCALIGLQRNPEAAVAFLQCLVRDQENAAVKTSTVKLLYRIFEEETENCGVNVPAPESQVLKVIQTIENIVPSMPAEEENGEPCEKKPRHGLTDCRVDSFECTLCCRLLHHPVTTPCGHTFCRSCLDRSLDHRPGCPICRGCLSQVLATRKENVTIAVESMMLKLFPEEYEERKKQHEEDMALLASVADNTSEEIPVFVCSLAMPLMPCPLHIFEPRYRLMVRQCMESGSRQFGMCMYNEDEDFSEYGTMLEIREVRYLPDGRSFVDTIGGRRFRVLSRGMRDGYSVARVEWIRDDPVPEEDLPQLKEFHKAVFDQASNWFNSLPLLVRRRVVNTVSEMPSWEEDTETKPSGAVWLWWLLNVCPLDPTAQVRILGMTSLRERLEILQRLLTLVAL